MKLLRTPHFTRAYSRAPKEIQAAFDKQSLLLHQDLRHPSLRVQKYDEGIDRWRGRVTKDEAPLPNLQQYPRGPVPFAERRVQPRVGREGWKNEAAWLKCFRAVITAATPDTLLSSGVGEATQLGPKENYRCGCYVIANAIPERPFGRFQC